MALVTGRYSNERVRDGSFLALTAREFGVFKAMAEATAINRLTVSEGHTLHFFNVSPGLRLLVRSMEIEKRFEIEFSAQFYDNYDLVNLEFLRLVARLFPGKYHSFQDSKGYLATLKMSERLMSIQFFESGDIIVPNIASAINIADTVAEGLADSVFELGPTHSVFVFGLSKDLAQAFKRLLEVRGWIYSAGLGGHYPRFLERFDSSLLGETSDASKHAPGSKSDRTDLELLLGHDPFRIVMDYIADKPRG